MYSFLYHVDMEGEGGRYKSKLQQKYQNNCAYVRMIVHGNDAADTYFKNGTLGTP